MTLNKRAIGSVPVFSSLIGVGMVWLVGITLAAGGQSAADQPMLAKDVFKNVQVMGDMPVADFMTSMGFMCASLAFDCADCHNAAGTQYVDWAADTPRKRTARRMVTMVENINRENFGGRVMVTCWTCHRNRDRPTTSPTMDIMYGEPTLQPDEIITQRPGMPQAATILDKYIAAAGGADRLAQLRSYVASATSLGFGGFGGGGVVEISAQAPDKRSTIIRFPEAPDRGESTRTYNGSQGWIRTPLSVLGEYQLSGAELDGARVDALLGFPGQIKTALTNFRVGFPEDVNGRTNQVVQGDGPNTMPVTLYFDNDTGLLTRVIRYSRSPIGRMPTQVDYSDYRDVDGVKMPFKWTFSWLDGRDTFTLTNIRLNVPVDAGRFEKPSTAAGAR
jgi:photosynthetic reaction center cytochrome c subunit